MIASSRKSWKMSSASIGTLPTIEADDIFQFAEKLEDVVSLYRHPPDNAIIRSVDEKCQIQALDRTQPGLPWKKRRCGTMTHDYKRYGTTILFAAMNTQDGSVIDVCMPTHNRWDWIRFLKIIDRRTPPDKQLHLIMDNYSGHPCQSSVAVCAAGSPSVETGVGIAARPG